MIKDAIHASDNLKNRNIKIFVQGSYANNTNVKAESTYDYNFGSVKIIAFKAKYLNGDIRLNDHDDIKWVEINDLHNFDYVEADILL